MNRLDINSVQINLNSVFFMPRPAILALEVALKLLLKLDQFVDMNHYKKQNDDQENICGLIQTCRCNLLPLWPTRSSLRF